MPVLSSPSGIENDSVTLPVSMSALGVRNAQDRGTGRPSSFSLNTMTNQIKRTKQLYAPGRECYKVQTNNSIQYSRVKKSK